MSYKSSQNDSRSHFGTAITFIVLSLLLILALCIQHFYYARQIKRYENQTKGLELEARMTLKGLEKDDLV